MRATTIHQEARFLFELALNYTANEATWREEHPKTPPWLTTKIITSKRRAALKKAAREAVSRAAEINSEHLCRDFSRGIGSGRAAHWFSGTFRRYSICARIAHETLGLSGESCRRVAREILTTGTMLGAPGRATLWDAVAKKPVSIPGDPTPAGYTDWRDWYRRNVEPEIARVEALSELADLRRGRQKYIGGYLADSIISWREGEQGFEGCSGSERYKYYRAHPEMWDELLSYSPTGAAGDC